MGMESSDSMVVLPEADALDGEDMFEGYGSPRDYGRGAEMSGGAESGIQRLRRNLCEIVHSHGFQVTVIILVLLDCGIVISEIMLESSRDKKNHARETAEEVLHYLSLTILSLFMVEVMIKIFAMGKSFLKNKFEMFDAFVVVVSFTLDVVMSVTTTGALKDGVGFIVLLRLWRITRIINGIIVSVKSKAEEQIRLLRKDKMELEETAHQLELKLEAQKKEIKYLKKKLLSLGVDVDQPSELRDMRAQLEESVG